MGFYWSVWVSYSCVVSFPGVRFPELRDFLRAFDRSKAEARRVRFFPAFEYADNSYSFGSVVARQLGDGVFQVSYYLHGVELQEGDNFIWLGLSKALPEFRVEGGF